MNPTDRVSITLEAQQWQVICNLLAEGPYRVVAPLLQVIQDQYNQQVQIPAGSNGAEYQPTPPLSA